MIRKRKILKVSFVVFIAFILLYPSLFHYESNYHKSMVISVVSKVNTSETLIQRSKKSICYDGWNTSFAKRFPHIMIIGFGKAGTRAVYQMIRMHPNVVGPSNELRFFSSDLKYKGGIDSYIRLMPRTTNEQKTIEKSPDYITKAGTAERIKKALLYCERLDEVKFIVVLRNPVDRAVSEYLEWKRHLRLTNLNDFQKRALKKSGKIKNHNIQVRKFC